MATAFHFVISILLLQMYAHGKENATNASTKLNALLPTLAALDDKNITNTQKEIIKNNETINNHQDNQAQRQKRGYNFNGFPPFPPIYPTYDFRNDLPINGAYGQEDPLVQIHKRLSEIAAILRQQTMPQVPPATRYPIFLPFPYPPSTNSGCTPGEDKRPPQPNSTQKNTTQTMLTQTTLLSTNITNVPVNDTPSRVPDVSGGVTVSYTEDDGDFSRPISFDPIPPINGVKRPPPPVEHGSVQAEITPDESVGATTTRQPPINNNANRYIPILSTPSLQTPDSPTLCDKAIVSCCHQLTITYNCFATQGCPDPSLYGNPCDTAVVLKVIERLLRFYAPRNG